jgi:hypothetical protein
MPLNFITFRKTKFKTITKHQSLMLNEGIPNQTNYSALKNSFKTGDIIMFMGFDFAGYAIMGLEEAEGIDLFTHVGIVIDVPARGSMPAGLYFWQAMPADATNQFGPDYFKGVECNGAVAVPLEAILNWVNKQDTTSGATKYLLIARQLNQKMQPADESLLLAYMNEIAGRSFSSPVDDGMLLDYAAGVLSSKTNGTSSSDATFFCSKLASQTFQQAGMLPANLVTNSVLPGHFGSSEDNKKLVFQKGYSFGTDIYFIPD